MLALGVRDPAYALAVVRDVRAHGDTLPAGVDVSPRRKINRWWYLSFAGEGGWRGACIVPGESMGAAVGMAWTLNCNPGGGVLGCPVEVDKVPEEFRCILLTETQVDELDRVLGPGKAKPLSTNA